MDQQTPTAVYIESLTNVYHYVLETMHYAEGQNDLAMVGHLAIIGNGVKFLLASLVASVEPPAPAKQNPLDFISWKKQNKPA